MASNAWSSDGNKHLWLSNRNTSAFMAFYSQKEKKVNAFANAIANIWYDAVQNYDVTTYPPFRWNVRLEIFIVVELHLAVHSLYFAHGIEYDRMHPVALGPIWTASLLFLSLTRRWQILARREELTLNRVKETQTDAEGHRKRLGGEKRGSLFSQVSHLCLAK